MSDLQDLQREHAQWMDYNFPTREPYYHVLGLVEECGELCRAMGVIHEESWRLLDSYDGRYEVSDYGNIRRARPGKSTYVGRHITQQINDDGYLTAFLSNGSKDDQHQHFVHVLVAEAWIGPKPEGFEVNHKDGDKQNNAIWNLEYLSPSDNQRHAISIGLRKVRRGEEHGGAKLSWDQVKQIRQLYATGDFTMMALANRFIVSKKTILLIIQGKTWNETPPSLNREDVSKCLKIQDAIGRLSHHMLKQMQGNRGSHEFHQEAMADAIGDIAIFLLGLSSDLGIDFEVLVQETWAAVSRRDWVRYPTNGKDH